jgi:hypothetical protein
MVAALALILLKVILAVSFLASLKLSSISAFLTPKKRKGALILLDAFVFHDAARHWATL